MPSCSPGEDEALDGAEETTALLREDYGRGGQRLLRPLRQRRDARGRWIWWQEAADAMRQAGPLQRRLSPSWRRSWSSLRYDLDDAAERVRDKKEEMEFSPSELDQLESRLDTIYRLQKKYGSTVEEMLQYLERCRAELETDPVAQPTPWRNWRQKLQAAQADAAKVAAKLTALRKKQAVLLQQRIQKELRGLGYAQSAL